MTTRSAGLLAPVLGIAVAVALGAGPAAAERKPLSQVSTSKLGDETQKDSEAIVGMNLVWWLPVEFWEATLLQDKSVSEEDRKEMIEALQPYFFVVVVRARDGALGPVMLDRKAVADGLAVSRVGADGNATVLRPVEKVNQQAETVLNVLKPMFASLLGSMGENMHVFVFSDRDRQGKRVMDPYEKGALVVELKKLARVEALKAEIECPLNALFVPRHCAKCGKEAHISWKFCPWCGRELPRGAPAPATQPK